MRKLAAIAAVVTISCGVLTACSGNDAYCSALKDNTGITKGSDTDTPKVLAEMKKVRGDAPKEVQDDWDVMISFLEKVESAGKDPAKAGALAAEQAKIEGALKNIEKHAKDECKVDLQKS